jgi:hypothetical protein
MGPSIIPDRTHIRPRRIHTGHPEYETLTCIVDYLASRLIARWLRFGYLPEVENSDTGNCVRFLYPVLEPESTSSPAITIVTGIVAITIVIGIAAVSGTWARVFGRWVAAPFRVARIKIVRRQSQFRLRQEKLNRGGIIGNFTCYSATFTGRPLKLEPGFKSETRLVFYDTSSQKEN